MPRADKHPDWSKEMDADAHLRSYHDFLRILVWTGALIAALLLVMFWLLV